MSAEQYETPVTQEQQLAPEQTGGRLRGYFYRALGAVTVAGAVLSSAVFGSNQAEPTAETEAAPAAYSAPSCYGDYCTGQDPNATGCAQEGQVVTLDKYAINSNGGKLALGWGLVSLETNSDPNLVGVVELRYSELCKTAWTRLSTRTASDVLRIGLQKDDGYETYYDVGGEVPFGTAAGTFYTPMVYGRSDSSFRAYSESAPFYSVLKDEEGTFWRDGRE